MDLSSSNTSSVVNCESTTSESRKRKRTFEVLFSDKKIELDALPTPNLLTSVVEMTPCSSSNKIKPGTSNNSSIPRDPRKKTKDQEETKMSQQIVSDTLKTILIRKALEDIPRLAEELHEKKKVDLKQLKMVYELEETMSDADISVIPLVGGNDIMDVSKASSRNYRVSTPSGLPISRPSIEDIKRAVKCSLEFIEQKFPACLPESSKKRQV